MPQFLSILLREQFTFFYRAGYTFIPVPALISLESEIDDNVKVKVVKKFRTVTPFFYDQEYLILHLKKELNNESEFVQFEIQDIVAIYPLSKQAKASIESRIDQRIRLEKPIFETVLPAIEADIENKEVEKAISALWEICKIESQLEKYVANIGLENIFNGLEFRRNGTKSNKIQNGNYWEHLIAYDRYDAFPNSTLGYFYDAGQVFAFSKGHSTFEGSGIHNFLEKLNSANPTAKLPDIIEHLKTEEQLKGYVSQTTKSDIKQYIVAPLYLMLRDEIRMSDDISQTKLFRNLDYLKKFEDSFNYTVILLGAFFGFRKFYDNYYEALNLRFYKDYKAPLKHIEKLEQEERINTNPETDKSIETKIEEVQEKTTETKEEETEAPSVEEPIIVSNMEILQKYKQSEIIVEKQSDTSNTQQDDNKEVVSDITIQYQKIIEQALNVQFEIKYVDIPKLIKQRTGRTIDKDFAIKITEQMGNVEKAKIGNVKNPNGIRQKGKTGPLFNE